MLSLVDEEEFFLSLVDEEEFLLSLVTGEGFLSLVDEEEFFTQLCALFLLSLHFCPVVVERKCLFLIKYQFHIEITVYMNFFKLKGWAVVSVFSPVIHVIV